MSMATIPLTSPPVTGGWNPILSNTQESPLSRRKILTTDIACNLNAAKNASFVGRDCTELFACQRQLLKERSKTVNGKKRGEMAVRAAVMQASPLPMSSSRTAVTNSSPVEELQKLRLITALKTPYLPDGRFDLEAYDSLVDNQIKSGVEGLIIGGTTGEGHLMSWDEHIMLIAHTVNCFGNKLKVIGNTGSNCTREAIRATEQGFAVGMHGALHINPYYGKTSADGLVTHFKSVMSLGPTIIYNVPGRTGQDIPPRVIESISSDPNFAGVKECVGNERIGEYSQQGLTVWSGNDDQCHDGRWDYGARGVMSVMSNLIPGLTRELMFDGCNKELNAKLMPLIDWLFVEPNPIGLNTALAMLGLIRPVFRLPYVPLPINKRREFLRIVEDLGLEHFTGSKAVNLLEDDDFSLVARY